ncbi:S41 family peptidase [Bacillus fonticola]|uniref:S41 family peptidase n=1 Tax=Bacillus fonticola TaxID=2728853 RepID=UPI001D158186|nr:S41 family peptidase [Bacillus fonticola]
MDKHEQSNQDTTTDESIETENNHPMDDSRDEGVLDSSEEEQVSNRWVRFKPFPFVMLIFVTIFATAGITTFALTYGEEKAVEVGMPEPRDEFSKLYEAYDELQATYFEPLDQDVLVEGAINGMFDAIDDPYSDYMNIEEAEGFYDTLSSSFQGIGAEIQQQNNTIIIVSPLKGSPAEKAGLLPNDRILEVDGESIQGMDAREASLIIRGEKGSEVTLLIERPGTDEPFEVTLTRDEIPLETVYEEMVSETIGTIQVTNFSENTTADVKKAIATLEEEGMEQLILDLRGNPGGLLPEATAMSELFIPNGEPILSIEERSGTKQTYVSKAESTFDKPVVVLIDGGSASASEIVAAAMQETLDTPIIGQTSFGKGTVQTAIDFEDGSNMKYTTARWLTPDGNWVNEKGVQPDVEVTLPAYYQLPLVNTKNTYEEGVVSADVQVIETILELLGYAPGTVDESFDSETTVAVKAFQEAEDLEVTGILTEEGTTVLFQALQQYALNNDPFVQEAENVLNGENTSTSGEKSDDAA